MEMDWSYISVKWKRWFYQDMPTAADGMGWHNWTVKSKKNKVRWFLAETAPDWLLSTFVWPVQRKRDSLRMRFKSKMWRIDIATLDKYEYHENDTQMLHGMFHILTRFVKIEKAWMQHLSNSWKDEDNIEEDGFIKHVNRARRDKKTWRNADKRAYAFKHLDWEISLGDPKSKNYDKSYYESKYHINPDRKHMTQAESAKEIKQLYIWWNDTRPQRPDPMDIRGDKGVSWSEYCVLDKPAYDDKGNELNFMAILGNSSDAGTEISDSASKVMHEAEEAYDKEDEEMLIRLIKVRKNLWT